MKTKILLLKRLLGVFVALGIFVGAWLMDRPKPALADIQSLPFQITEVSQQTGAIHTHKTFPARPGFSHVEKFVVSDTAMVSVVDYDNDGWPDIFANSAATESQSSLFHNNKDGTFTEVSKQAGLAIFDPTFSFLGGYFFDYDNDGNKDIMIIGRREKIRIFKNQGNGTFKPSLIIQVGVEDSDRAPLAALVPAFIDFNNDGFMDFIVANKWGSGMPNSLVDATNGGLVFVFKNIEGRRFEHVPDNLGMNHKGFTRSIATYDLRGTGRADVWFANDFSPDKLYLNNGDGTFKNSSGSILSHNFSRNGMNTDVADLENDGHPVTFVSHIFEKAYRPAGNTMWKWIEGDQFQEIARERGVAKCGWAWGGKFIDLDNNGFLDLVVGNGFISANKNKNYWYALSVLSGADRSVTGSPTNWPPIGDASLAGYQQSCVFYNDGTGHFTDVVKATGMMGDISDERGIAVIDYLNNGSQSLVVANQAQALKLYRVDQRDSNNKWIGFKLIGGKKNRDAFGAKMKVLLENGKQLSRQLQTLNGFGSQSDDRLHFGLGSEPAIKSIQLTWSSGKTQEFSGSQYALGQYHTIGEVQ